MKSCQHLEVWLILSAAYNHEITVLNYITKSVLFLVHVNGKHSSLRNVKSWNFLCKRRVTYQGNLQNLCGIVYIIGAPLRTVVFFSEWQKTARVCMRQKNSVSARSVL